MIIKWVWGAECLIPGVIKSNKESLDIAEGKGKCKVIT